MISGHITLTDLARFKDSAANLRRQTGKSVAEFVLWRSAIIAKDLIKFTPPCGKQPSKESFNKQRQRGQKIVYRDIVRLFPELSNIHLIKNPANPNIVRAVGYLNRYIASRNLGAIQTILRGFGFSIPLVLQKATEAVHKGARDQSTGRVKAGVHYPVLDKGSIATVVRSAQKDVGKMKHGWMAAANYLNVKGIPAWIRNPFAPDGYKQDNTNHPTNPSFFIGNNAKGIERMGNIVEAVVAINERKIVKEELAKRLHQAFRYSGATP